MPRLPHPPHLVYGVDGPADAPRTLLFHNGLGGVKEAWFHQVQAFRQRHRVVVYDMRGAGASPPGPGCTVGDFAADAVRLMDHLGVRRAVMVGISFGGRVALQLAVDHPERVEALVLSGTSAGGRGHHPGDPEAHAALREAIHLDEEAFFRSVVPALFGPAYVRANERRLRVWARSRVRRRPDPEGIRCMWEAWRRFDVADRLEEVRQPALVLHGDADRISPLENARFLVEHLPGAELVVLPGVGHSPNVEDPAAFNVAVQRFLDRLP